MATHEPKLPTQIAAARAGAAGQAYLSQGACINWLLDCRSVCTVASGRAVIDDALADMAHLAVISGPYFRSVVDQLDAAVAVESAFDSMQLHMA